VKTLWKINFFDLDNATEGRPFIFKVLVFFSTFRKGWGSIKGTLPTNIVPTLYNAAIYFLNILSALNRSI